VPRITLTYPAQQSSRDVAFLVTGAAKREAMQRIADGEANG
jgi:6-phosphogluconolactonase